MSDSILDVIQTEVAGLIERRAERRFRDFKWKIESAFDEATGGQKPPSELAAALASCEGRIRELVRQEVTETVVGNLLRRPEAGTP